MASFAALFASRPSKEQVEKSGKVKRYKIATDELAVRHGVQVTEWPSDVEAERAPLPPASHVARWRGALLGMCVADAVGTTVEFQRPGSFTPVTDMTGGGPFDVPCGAFTDDSSMGLCLAASLHESGGWDANDCMEKFCRWFEDGYMSAVGVCFDIGSTTRGALLRYRKDSSNPYCGLEDTERCPNGSLMRIVPVAMYYASIPEEASRVARLSSRTTHGSSICQDACDYYTGLIIGALRGESKETILSNHYTPRQGAVPPYHADIAEVAAGSFKTKSPPEIKGTGHVVKCLEAALWAFYTTSSFKEGCLAATNLGDDADTTAAVYGMIAGAYYGEDGIPGSWRQKIALHYTICHYAEALYNHSENPSAIAGTSSHPRKTLLFYGGATADDIPDQLRAKLGSAFEIVETRSGDESLAIINGRSDLSVFVTKMGKAGETLCWPLIEAAHERHPTCFIVVHSFTAVQSAKTRMKLTDSGANMVSVDMTAIVSTLTFIGSQGLSGKGRYTCHYCELGGLTEDELWTHTPMYHINSKNVYTKCPICGADSRLPLQVHIRNAHGPCARGEVHAETNTRTDLAAFALVVVRHPAGKYLLVQEFCNSGYWLPGGRVDGGESLDVAAVRETKEEAGIDVRLTGVLQFQYHPLTEDYIRLRVIFLAEPVDPDQLPKSVPDYESVGATWATLEEVQACDRLRGSEPLVWIPYVANGGYVAPMEVLANFES